VLSAASAIAGDVANEDLKKLQGSWKVISVQVSGESAPKEDFEKAEIVFKGKQLSAKNVKGTALRILVGGEGGPEDVATFTIEPGEKQMDVVVVKITSDNGGKGQFKHTKATVLGIYTFNGAKLKIVVGNLPDEKKRPTEFRTTKNDNRTLVVLERKE